MDGEQETVIKLGRLAGARSISSLKIYDLKSNNLFNHSDFILPTASHCQLTTVNDEAGWISTSHIHQN